MDVTTIFINGNIVTMKDEIQAEALAVSNDKIVATGSNYEIKSMANTLTQVIDLKEKTLLPGFIDTHMHIVGYGFSFEAIDLLGLPSLESLIDKCKKYIEENDIAEGVWILGRGFDQNVFEDVNGFPTSKDLNKISENHPILLLRTCGHIGIANDLALNLAEVDENTFVRGGSFDKYEDGKPNGVIKEASLEWFKIKMSQSRTVDDLKRAIMAGGNDLSRYGITSVHTEDSYDLGYAGDLSELYEAYKQLIFEGNLKQRVYQKISLPRMSDVDDFLKRFLHTGLGNDFFRIGPVKLWADGTLGGRTAWLLEDYDDEPGQKGIAVYEDDEMTDIIKKCQDNNLQMCIHSIGDAALEQILNAYENASSGKDMKAFRHRIVHCQIGHYDQYQRIADMGININIQPMHTRTDYPLIEHRLGSERSSKCHAWNTIQEYGVLVTGSSDVPCTNCDNAASVFAGISEIVNRDYWLKDEEVSVYDALKMYTVNAAYSAFEEDVKGTIENGKFADFVILSENPMSIKKENIKDIEVEMTILGGKVVYRK
ncbi:hypothetical protein SAMN02745751_03466 [Dethiosulfatibacter aminovorans DSM 17477]|uniref:Amidohydrolase 3 domain-containing protein n=1 Tax=Dethiosulfatibacter aminovorans DSM 17477 TaxID=1121476 RepID=A0A1M6MGN2_9FIRM|nr:amidohydrolase [Dethiosulfatibacter aminovorans]SHJ82614.1 hypothetical protein SAMN02745751_03466 [Dethiosulfatibacter aminovorans DSM 17477]